jgi:hypothetical protein
MKQCLFYGTVLTAVMVGVCTAAPEPAIVQGPGLWTVEAKFEHPQQIVLPWGGNGENRFWYIILTVTNRTGEDVAFFPRCELMSEAFQIVKAGNKVPPVVFERIQQRHAVRYPFLEPLDGLENRILQGQDNARDIAIIWPDFDKRSKSFKVFITGLSNETAVVDHPVAIGADGQPVPVFLRKTLELNYNLRGDPAIRSSVGVAYKGKDWVMR